MKNVLLLALSLASGLLYAADERTRKDINQVSTILVLTRMDEIRNLRSTDNGNLLITVDGGTVTVMGSTITANQGGAWNINLSSAQPAAVRDANALGRVWAYESDTFISTGTINFPGMGNSWLISAKGGSLTFNISGGDPITINSGDALHSDFQLGKFNPAVNITAIDPGASAFVYLDGMK